MIPRTGKFVGFFLFPLLTLRPVSYTHLDVYKRQILDEQDKIDRLKLQRRALTGCKKLLYLIELSKKRGYIDTGTFDYWTKLTLDVKFMTAAWYKACLLYTSRCV